MVLFGKFKPEDPKTEGLVNTTRSDVLELLNELYEVWDPPHQTWLLNNSPKVAAVVAIVPAMFLCHRIRRLFGLHKFAKASDAIFYAPAISVAGAPAFFWHKQMVRDDIVLQETDCSVCVDIRSAVGQFTAGIFLPFMLAYAGGIASAINYNLRIVPTNMKSFVVLSKGLFRKLAIPLSAMSFIQLGTSAFLVRKQYADRDIVMAELEARYTREQQMFKPYK
jgi:hypothetical protein